MRVSIVVATAKVTFFEQITTITLHYSELGALLLLLQR